MSRPAVSPLAPAFPRAPGETPRAFAAFAAYFQLGHDRSLQAVADQLGENLATVKNWSSKYGWSARLHAHTAGLLDQQVAAAREHVADWTRRTQELREQEWLAAQKLLDAAQCFLDGFGDAELQRMSLGQVSRAMQIASRLARHSLSVAPPPEEPGSLLPVQTELVAALKKIFGPSGEVPDLPAPSASENSPAQAPTS